MMKYEGEGIIGQLTGLYTLVHENLCSATSETITPYLTLLSETGRSGQITRTIHLSPTAP